MALDDDSPKPPAITREGNLKQSSYFLNRGGNRTRISDWTLGLIDALNEKAPGLVCVTSLLPSTWYQDREQGLAERMHQLSQQDTLGDFLQCESYGAFIVGYRLTQKIDAGPISTLKIYSPDFDH